MASRFLRCVSLNSLANSCSHENRSPGSASRHPCTQANPNHTSRPTNSSSAMLELPRTPLPEGGEGAHRPCSRQCVSLKDRVAFTMVRRARGALRQMSTTTANRSLQLFGRRLRPEGVIALVGLAVVWQIVSYFTPPFLFPSVPQIAARFVEIFSAAGTAYDAAATALRILAGLAGAFVLGSVLAMLMARSDAFERYCYPLLNFNQGIPALSWVVIAI